jgi:hypothetical protein
MVDCHDLATDLSSRVCRPLPEAAKALDALNREPRVLSIGLGSEHVTAATLYGRRVAV